VVWFKSFTFCDLIMRYVTIIQCLAVRLCHGILGYDDWIPVGLGVAGPCLCAIVGYLNLRFLYVFDCWFFVLL
jgi:hypothetical protein